MCSMYYIIIWMPSVLIIFYIDYYVYIVSLCALVKSLKNVLY